MFWDYRNSDEESLLSVSQSNGLKFIPASIKQPPLTKRPLIKVPKIMSIKYFSKNVLTCYLTKRPRLRSPFGLPDEAFAIFLRHPIQAAIQNLIHEVWLSFGKKR